jgi:hypothetical protein
MRAFDNALHLTAGASPERVALARELLESRKGVVVLEGRVALRPEGGGITCEVIDPSHDSTGSEAHYERLVAEGQKLIEAFALVGFVEASPRRWIVVTDSGMGAVQLWPVV